MYATRNHIDIVAISLAFVAFVPHVMQSVEADICYYCMLLSPPCGICVQYNSRALVPEKVLLTDFRCRLLIANTSFCIFRTTMDKLKMQTCMNLYAQV